MKPLLTMVFAGLASPVLAHPTHIIDLAGHNHWLAAAAVAAAAALWQAKNRGEHSENEDEVEADLDAEPQEA